MCRTQKFVLVDKISMLFPRNFPDFLNFWVSRPSIQKVRLCAVGFLGHQTQKLGQHVQKLGHQAEKLPNIPECSLLKIEVFRIIFGALEILLSSKKSSVHVAKTSESELARKYTFSEYSSISSEMMTWKTNFHSVT